MLSSANTAAAEQPELALPGPVRALAERLGKDEAALPAYVYDLDGLAAHVAAIRAALPRPLELCYAVKANPDPEVLRVVARHADSLEVASAGELRHAAATAPGAVLAFGGPGKTPAELAEAVRVGTFRFHVESPHELRLLGAAARAAGRIADVLLRVNLPDHPAGPVPTPTRPRTETMAPTTKPAATAKDVPAVGATPAAQPGPPAVPSLVMGGQPTPFGMDQAQLGQCAEWLAGGGREASAIRLRGIHAHLASGLEPPELLDSARRVLEFARPWCAAHRVSDPEFNLGGGMAVDYHRPAARFDWAEYGRGLAELARPGETLRVEPGRAVTAYCGWYVTRVLDVKQSHRKAFAVVAGGTHHLRTPAAKGHSQPFTILPVAAWPHDWARPAARDEPVTIAGQLCTPKDVLAREVAVTVLRAGDLVAFGLAGAYAWNISHLDFLMHPRPGFHYLRETEHETERAGNEPSGANEMTS
jgi:diaminopimelate decarboxylase